MAVAAGSALLGLAGGVVWQHLAPRVLLVAVGHGTADIVNPETSAFIVTDGWFCVVGLAGGVITGLLGYLLAVRRYGPLPMAGLFAGGLAAAYAARWAGERSGLAAFHVRLATAPAGTVLQAPIALGALGALAFWPLAAGLAAGGLAAAAALRGDAGGSGRAGGPGDDGRPEGGIG